MVKLENLIAELHPDMPQAQRVAYAKIAADAAKTPTISDAKAEQIRKAYKTLRAKGIEAL